MFQVTADVEAGWAELAARSQRFADDRGDGAPFVRFFTDTGAAGSIPLTVAPIRFDDIGPEPLDDDIGTIVSVLPGDPEIIGQDLTARTPPVAGLDIEGMPEDERLRILADLHASHPDVDHARLASGALAGRATADRPDVPPWGYEDYAAEHPATSLEDLIRVRFPEFYAKQRGATIRSIAEDIDDHGQPDGALFTLEEALDQWRFLHDAGVIRWNSATRAVEHARGFGEVSAAQRRWATRLRNLRTDTD